MKYLIILSAILIFSFSTSAQPSIWEITTGTTFEVQTNADFCVDSIRNLGGTLIFNGTRCGNPLGIISSTAEIPKEFRLYDNYPNPFNPATTIEYGLPSASRVVLRLYDFLGREVTTLVNEAQTAGYHSVRFDASGLASGVYFYRLIAGKFVQTKRMVLVR